MDVQVINNIHLHAPSELKSVKRTLIVNNRYFFARNELRQNKLSNFFLNSQLSKYFNIMRKISSCCDVNVFWIKN